jgi:hypothetical protein
MHDKPPGFAMSAEMVIYRRDVREFTREERRRAGLPVGASVYRGVLAVKDEGGAPSPPAAVFDP